MQRQLELATQYAFRCICECCSDCKYIELEQQMDACVCTNCAHLCVYTQNNKQQACAFCNTDLSELHSKLDQHFMQSEKLLNSFHMIIGNNNDKRKQMENIKTLQHLYTTLEANLHANNQQLNTLRAKLIEVLMLYGHVQSETLFKLIEQYLQVIYHAVYYVMYKY